MEVDSKTPGKELAPEEGKCGGDDYVEKSAWHPCTMAWLKPENPGTIRAHSAGICSSRTPEPR